MRRGRTGGAQRHRCHARDGTLLALLTFTVSISGAQNSLMGQQPAPLASPAEVAAAANEETSATQRLEQVIVTGYVVPRVGIGPAPVVTLDQDYIQKQGDQTVADVVLRLPQNVGSFTPLVNPGASFSPGASAANLRGLGINSTLVLIDGLRQVPYPFPQNGTQSFVDLNSIPLAAVDRIEVLKDGASARYGSDAIAGVVNIILKDEYDGADISTYFGTSQRGDAAIYRTSLVGGIAKQLSETAHFNILAAFDYFEQDPIQSVDRSYSFILDHQKFGSFFDFSSTNAPAGNFTDAAGNLYAVIPGTKGPQISASDFSIVPAPNDGSPQNLYNETPFQELLPREQRYGGYVKLDYQPFQWLKIYEEFYGNHLEETNQAAPTTVGTTDGIIIPATNPNNPFGVPLTPNGWRVLEYGATKGSVTVNTYRFVSGVSLINLPKNWFVDANFLYSESDGDSTTSNAVSKSGLNAALAGTLPGFPGVFYNPFTDTSTGVRLNQPLVNATRITLDNNSRTDLTMWSVRAGGEVFDLPAGPITVGAGGEYRSDSFVQVMDRNSTNFNVVGFGGGNGGGKDYIWSGYGELTIPVLGGKFAIPGARSLQVILAERFDTYSSSGNAWKPKISVLFKPIDDLILRASYSEGFRAPFVTELFAGELIGFQTLTDPVTQTTNTFELRTFGNPNLKPENSYGYYAGAVWTPGSTDPDHSWWGWANGFTAYVDWSEITKRNEITLLNPQFLLANEAQFPGAVVRLADGAIDHINDPFLNLASVRVDSIDFGGSYVTKEFGWGKLNAEVDATWYYHAMQQNQPGTPLENITDTFGFPDFKMTASIFYSKTLFGIDTFSTGFTLNYIDSEHDEFDTFQGALSANNAEPNGLVHRIGSFTTVDWQISYQLGKPEEITPQTPPPGYSKDGKRILGEKAISPKPEGPSAGWRRWFADTKVTFGINNIGDVRPPFSDSLAGFDTQTTNPFGRYYYVQFEKKF
jgi:iron complex outermembrane recepter protein